MINYGMFSTLYLEQFKAKASLDDAAQGRMSTLAQTWASHSNDTQETLWDSFLKLALSYLEFVPPGQPDASRMFPLFEDWGFSECLTVLCLVPPDADIDDMAVGRFYPAKLINQLEARKLKWGILTDGNLWRLYCTKSSRPFEDYVQLDLGQTLSAQDENEYWLFEQFFHKDAFVPLDKDEEMESAGVYSCQLDTNQKESEDALEELVKKPLLYQIDEVLQYICNGFIFDTSKSGEEYTEQERAEIFESAVKLLYRCLFLFYAESRRLLPTDREKAAIYDQHSMQALCREAHKFAWGKRHDTDQHDLWKHLKGLVHAVNDGDPEYGIMGYDGGLFDDSEEIFLGEHQLRNDFLARALYLMTFVAPADNEPENEYPVPYEDLEVRHLGELYEYILEYSVQLADADRIKRRTKKGFEILLASQDTLHKGDTLIKKGEVFFAESALERKQTGSYYTPESLVRFLNSKAIVQPLHDEFEAKYRKRFTELLDQAENAYDQSTRNGALQGAAAVVERFVHEDVLNYKVCDPAMGSGHFLVNAANQMTGLVISLLNEIPATHGLELNLTSRPNDWRRQITRHCLYGVDLNPLAVNLAKLSLWLNSFAGRHRLTFLDHHLRQGNSLIGLRSLTQLQSMPQRKKDTKKKEVKGWVKLPGLQEMSSQISQAQELLDSIAAIGEDNLEAQKEIHVQAREETQKTEELADLFTFYLMHQDTEAEDYKYLFDHLAKGKSEAQASKWYQELLSTMHELKAKHNFFHWPVEFPDVFGPQAVQGFSATVGNPPWDIVKPNSQEFFSDYDPKFRSYKKQEANRIANKLMTDNPAIEEKWQDYCQAISEQSTYFKEPLSYSALGKGDINTFKLFLEQFFQVLKNEGRIGIVVPSGLYTDQGCQPLRQLLFDQSRVNFLYCFENRWPTVFNGVDGRSKFITLSVQKGKKTDTFKCVFMEHDPDRLLAIDANALKMSVDQVKKFSPETLSVMEFKSQQDIEVTSKIYGHWRLLGEKLKDTWNVKFRRELDMTNDSHLFKTEPTDCPLYEGKMINLFDSDFDNPRYWLDRSEVEESIGTNGFEGRKYRYGFRNIGRSTDSRTLIGSIIPPSFHGNSLPTISPYSDKWRGPNNQETLWIALILSSFCIDYVIRQKVSANINFFYVESLPVPRDNKYKIGKTIIASTSRLFCYKKDFKKLWENLFLTEWQSPDFWYPSSAPIDSYGPAHEQDIRRRLRDEAPNLTPEWGPHCGVHDRLPDRRDTGDRAQLRAEIDAYVAHLYGLSRDDFAYILETFPVLKKKEEKAFGEFMSKRKCLEEFDRIGKVLNMG